MGIKEIQAMNAKRTGFAPKESADRSASDEKPAVKGTPKAKKKKKGGPKKRSDKMRAIISALTPAYERFLSTRPFCRIKSVVCTSAATIVHHLKGRTPKVILDEHYWCEACPSCNLYVEEHPDWAMENGFKISKFDNRK
jgi:hypothetical protein